MVIITTTTHDFVTGERVHFAGDIYWVKVLDSNIVQLYDNSSLTAVAANVAGDSFASSTTALSLITPLDRAPNVEFRPGSAYTNDGRGVIGAFIFTTSISTNILNYNIKNAALAEGWDGNTLIYATVTIESGAYVYTDTTSTPALIKGKGGLGADPVGGGRPGGAGGPAMSINYPVTIVNNSYIAGGGGGGGASGLAGGGGGSGGGTGGSSPYGGGDLTRGGNGGAPGQRGANGAYDGNHGGVTWYQAPGGGGRILPGDTDVTGAGQGGYGGGAAGNFDLGCTGRGSGANRPGGNCAEGAGGGGWGAIGGAASGGAAGAAGKAINLNGFTATITGSGTIWGAVS